MHAVAGAPRVHCLEVLPLPPGVLDAPLERVGILRLDVVVVDVDVSETHDRPTRSSGRHTMMFSAYCLLVYLLARGASSQSQSRCKGWGSGHGHRFCAGQGGLWETHIVCLELFAQCAELKAIYSSGFLPFSVRWGKYRRDETRRDETRLPIFLLDCVASFSHVFIDFELPPPRP